MISAVLVVLVILAFVFVLFPLMYGVELPVDSENEAIVIASGDEGAQGFISRWMGQGLIVNSRAFFYEKQGVWIVSFVPEDTDDLYWEVHVHPNGDIIKSAHGMGA